MIMFSYDNVYIIVWFNELFVKEPCLLWDVIQWVEGVNVIAMLIWCVKGILVFFWHLMPSYLLWKGNLMSKICFLSEEWQDLLQKGRLI
jgi:hypothetical protein